MDPDELPARLHLEATPACGAREALDAAAYHGEAAVDIVAVHGLAAQYQRTWSVERPDGTRYSWLHEQLPKDLPHARVLGFEYQSSWYKHPAHVRLSTCGAELLRSLVQARCHRGQGRMCPTRRKRPLILIGHSFGGLVIKQALIRASQTPSSSASPEVMQEYQNHRDLLSCIAGVVFLGTPHRGSGFSVWAEAKSAWGSLVGRFTGDQPHPELISILRTNSTTVTSLQEEFQLLCSDGGRLAGLQLYCYYEKKPLLLPPHIVVNQDSACIDYAVVRGMNANHMEMNKFRGPDDANYRELLTDLRAILASATAQVYRQFEAWRYGTVGQDEHRNRLRRLLDPSQEPQSHQFARKLDCYQSAPYTCRWLLELGAVRQWQTSRENALWIHGKAGSGKSVLAAYLIDQLRSSYGAQSQSCDTTISDPDCEFLAVGTTILYFFCGVDRARETPARIIGTFIHQLLQRHNENEKLFNMAMNTLEKNGQKSGENISWQQLADLLASMLAVTGNTYIVVDGIEENQHWRKCFEALSILTQQHNVKLVMLSQGTRDIASEWRRTFKGSGHELNITDHSEGDILMFSRTRSAELISKKPWLSDKESLIADSLLRGAQGMFQWVNAALSHLDEEVEDPERVEDSFQNMPSELKSTWNRVFQRHAEKDDEQRDLKIRTALQLLAVSGRLVTLSEVKAVTDLATRGETAYASISDVENGESYRDVAAKEVPTLLGSLIEVDQDGDLVQLAHTSLLSALTSCDRATPESATFRYSFKTEEAHRTVSCLCMALCRISAFAHANAFGGHRLPLVEYAWDFWAYHLHQSQCSLENNKELQQNFDKMTFGVSTDVVSYLHALCQFLGEPLPMVPGHFSDGEYMRALQRAQDALLQPIGNLTALRKLFPISTSVEMAKVFFSDMDFGIPELTSMLKKFEKVQKALNATVKQHVEETSSVYRLKIDELLAERPMANLTDPCKLLLDAARNLRKLALRLAVDPVYSAIIVGAGGQSFSPLHMLLYTAQLFEQAGSFPAWDQVPPHPNLLASFDCSPKDSESSPAAFVLTCFEWRRRDRATEKLEQRYTRTGQLRLPEVRSGELPVAQTSLENEKQVRRLHGIDGERYITSMAVYNVFGAEEGWLKSFVTNPLAGLHRNKKLMVEDNWDLMVLGNPEEVLPLHAPISVEESPLKQVIRALPQLCRVYFVRFLCYVLEVFGRVSKQVLATHFARLEVAVFEVSWAFGFFGRFFKKEAPERLRLWYLVPACAVFWLRCRYAPIFGAYYMPHTWHQFIWAYKHPAAYLDLQNVAGFLMWFTTILRVWVYNGLGHGAVFMGLLSDEDDPKGRIANIYATFHGLCTLERSIFGIATVAATLVSCALVIMHDPTAMSNIFQLSIFYWFNVFFGLFMGAVQTGTLQNGGGFWGLLATSLIYVLVVFLASYNMDRVVRWLAYLLYPVTAPAMLVWRTFLRTRVDVAEVGGVLLLLAMAAVAFSWAHGWIWDPYDLKGSHQKLQQAAQLAQSSLFAADHRRIGHFPLGRGGGAATLRQTAAAAAPPTVATPVSPPPRRTPALAAAATRSARAKVKEE